MALAETLDRVIDRRGVMPVDLDISTHQGNWAALVHWANVQNKGKGGRLPTIDPNEGGRRHVRLAELCSRVRGVDIASALFAPDGTEPTIEVVPDRERRAAAVEQQVKQWVKDGKLTTSQVAVLSPYRPDGAGCSVGNRPRLGGLPVTTDPTAWRAGNGILVATIRSFKGLEADAIILTDVGKPEHAFSVADLYVACSRAKHFLTVFATEPMNV